MGSRTWHVARAEYHKTVADHLYTTEYEDWAIVALYYSALHFADSILADDPALPKDERQPRKHTGREPGSRGRNQLIAAQCPVINRDYRDLEEMSRRTRYDVKKLTDATSVYDKLLSSWQHIEHYARMMHMTRSPIPTDAP